MKKRALRVGRAIIGVIFILPAIALSPITYILFDKIYVEHCAALVLFEKGLK